VRKSILAAEKSVEFFKITRAYKIVVNRKNSILTSSFRAIANAGILQRVTQDQVTFNQNEQSNKSISKKHNHSINQKKNEKCICEKEHSVKKCSYIVSFNRKKE
jgi:hypothetical protein